jgi:anti-sigma regulatory factor (Ser/Thr protein kinase)
MRVVYRRVTARFEREAAEVQRARRLAQTVVEECGGDSDGAALVVSELAGNAVVHARSPFTVTVSCDESRTLIEVADGTPRLPRLRSASKAALGGRGLRLVRSLAISWGVHARARNGKTVWAELPKA